MSQEINYEAVAIPAEKPPEEYHYSHRRAELLQLIKRAGTPAVVNRRGMADRYGVSRQTIQNDVDALAEFVTDDLGGARAAFTATTVFEKAVSELMEDGEYEAAARVTDRWMSWLGDIGALEQAPERREVKMDARGAQGSFDVPDENVKRMEKMIDEAAESIEDTVVE